MKKLREKFNVLHKFSDNEWNYFAQKFTPKTFERDELLLRAGRVERYLYFIKTGLVRKYYLRQGREHCIDFMMDNPLMLLLFSKSRLLSIYVLLKKQM